MCIRGALSSLSYCSVSTPLRSYCSQGECEVVFGPAYMGHRMHVVRAVTQRAAAEYSWASGPERERERERTKKIGVAIFFSVFLERRQMRV